MLPSAPPTHVGVLAYHGCLGTEVFGIVDLLGADTDGLP
jgi:hypothetical protein